MPGTISIASDKPHSSERSVVFIRRSLFALTAATVVLSVASPVLAHVDPDPPEAQAGRRLSVGFTVQHGCDGSPTVQLDMRLPEGVSDAQPEPPDGWNGSVESDVVTFIGGPLPDDQELTFRVSMTLPATPDTTIYFPFVQRCEVGEIRWIAIPSADGSGTELDEPAPAMLLTGPAVTASTAAATTTVTPSTPAPASTGAPTQTSPATSIVTEASESGKDSLAEIGRAHV